MHLNFSIASGLTDFCRALYDYDATGSDEISFEEGDIIKVTKREPNGVDDGWWMGELRTGSHSGTTGLFPSIVVEECYENGDDSPDDYSLASPQSSVAPPSFSPPPRVPSAMILQDTKTGLNFDHLPTFVLFFNCGIQFIKSVLNSLFI